MSGEQNSTHGARILVRANFRKRPGAEWTNHYSTESYSFLITYEFVGTEPLGDFGTKQSSSESNIYSAPENPMLLESVF